jgi:hypothetical protein
MTKIFALALALAFTAPLVASASPTQSTAQKVMDTYHTHFTNAQ